MGRSITLVLAALLTSGASAPSERIIAGEGVFAGSVNGAPVRIRVDPAAVAMPLLTTSAAKRAGLKAGPFDFEYLVGPRRIVGKSAVSRIDMGTGAIRRRIGWTDAPYSPVVDGVVGPGLLPEKIIRFQLRPQRAGERTVSFSLVGQGGLDSDWGERFALIDVGGKPMRVQFDPNRQRTVATANAAVRIASAQSGHLSGETESIEVAFGVKRPVRQLKLERPLVIGPLQIPLLGVRTADFGSASAIADQAATRDPDEIVVVGTRKHNPNRDQIKLGRDYLDRCSSIVFDKAAKKVRLTCL